MPFDLPNATACNETCGQVGNMIWNWLHHYGKHRLTAQLRDGRRIEQVRNQVAVKRGPIVYCLESVDLR
jgi:DUF1680 family protein